MTYNPTFRQMELERHKVAAVTYVSRHVSHDVSEDVIHNQLIHKLESHVMVNRLDSQTVTASERVPATWWQAFKLSAIEQGNPFFKAAKVRYRTVELTTSYRVWAGFPECLIDFPRDLGLPRIYIDESHSSEWRT